MSASSLGVSSGLGSPISITGLASGLDTSSIIAALMAAEREPVTRLTNEQARFQAQESELQGIAGSLQQVALAASEFDLPSLFESSQTVSSSEPSRVGATTTEGAGAGGYEVEVTQLASSAQRTFAFTSPPGEDTITIDGHEFTVKEGESAKELASAINASSSATVYAAALETGMVVLSSRQTGNTGTEFIAVSDPGGVLSETGTPKQGKDAEFTVDGVPGTSSTNTVTNAIAGITLTLGGLTPTGPVTIDVQPPGASSGAVEAKVQSFITLYNSTVETIEKQLATKPPQKPQSASEFATGTLFGDLELSSLLDSMRTAMYEPIAGLPAEMSSPFDIGISTGAPTGAGAASQASLDGELTLDPSKLAQAVENNPVGVEQMLQHFSQSLQGVIDDAAQPGGALESRASADGAQIRQLNSQIANLNEMLAQREKALQATYAALERAISQNTAQGDWLTSQTEALSSQHA